MTQAEPKLFPTIPPPQWLCICTTQCRSCHCPFAHSHTLAHTRTYTHIPTHTPTLTLIQQTHINTNNKQNNRIGAQDDKLLFSSNKDATWADLGGYTEFASAAAYKEFKTWEATQPSYKAIPVKTRTRLVSST
jgi:hypothetical protein